MLLESGLMLELFFLEVSGAGVTVTVGNLVMVPGVVPELVLVVLEELDDIVVVWFGGRICCWWWVGLLRVGPLLVPIFACWIWGWRLEWVGCCPYMCMCP
jgi:hypothetical protein